MSRSLLAAHDALRSGRVRRVSHVKGGLYGYHLAGLPIEVCPTPQSGNHFLLYLL